MSDHAWMNQIVKATIATLTARAETAEAEVKRLREALATAQWKAEKYDAVVRALSVADGGRYRNDTIESVVIAARKAYEETSNDQ